MSHMVTVDTKLTSLPAIMAAAKAVGADVRQDDAVRFYDNSLKEGTAIRLPGWKYPVVVDTEGGLHFDNFNGSWGKTELLDSFRQQYALSVVTSTVGRRHKIQTKKLANGHLQVSIG